MLWKATDTSVVCVFLELSDPLSAHLCFEKAKLAHCLVFLFLFEFIVRTKGPKYTKQKYVVVFCCLFCHLYSSNSVEWTGNVMEKEGEG